MSDESTIMAAARERLGQMTTDAGTVFVWPNEAGTTARPRFEVQLGPITTRPVTVSGTNEATFLLQITAVVDANTGTMQADRMAQRIIDRFPSGLAVDAGSWVARRPDRGAGIQEDAEYRVPVTVTIRALLNKPA